MPSRIQRRRSKGWKLPDNAVCVTRPGPWGNPFVTGRDGAAPECVDLHRKLMAGYVCLSVQATTEDQMQHRNYVASHLDEIRGRDLACWCRIGNACHGDTLLRIANA
jgi:hypothetical protein